MASPLRDGSSHIKEGVVLTWSSHSLKLFNWTEVSVLCRHWEFLLDQDSKSRDCFWCDWWLHQLLFCFFYPPKSLSLFFIVSEMDGVKMRGRGCTSIYPAIHFIPLRGLDYSGETKVIRIHVIPKIQQKKKNLSKRPSHLFRQAADGCLFTKICRQTYHFARWQAF